MKAQERSAARPAQGNGAPKSGTGEWDGNGKVVSMGEDFVELEENTERALAPAEGKAPVENSKLARSTGDAHLPRERRSTVVSNIPAQLAKSMGEIRDPAGPVVARPWSEVRDPVLPRPSGRPAAARSNPGAPSAPMPPEVTRRVGTDEVESLAPDQPLDTYSVELVDELALPPAEQVRSLIDRARTHIDGGNLGAAVIAADQALAEAAKAPQSDVADLLKTSRPLFDRIFAAYVGLLGQVPVRARTDEEIAGQELGDRTQYLLKSIDGKQTLEQLAATTGIPPVEAMKIAASLLAAGIVRVK
jgi:hypothetical protein